MKAKAARAELTDPERPDLRSRILSGFTWKLASQGVSQAINTAVVLLLARLLDPRQFGIAAMAEVASGFVVTYADCGLGLALIQKETITDVDRSTVFWASLALGALMTGICIAVAPFAARFYHTPEVEPLLEVLSAAFFLTALASTHRSLHVRAMNFRALEIRTIASCVVGGCVTVVLALAGLGAWAIILGSLGATATSTILLLAMGRWVPRFAFSWRSLGDLGGFGLRYLGGTTFLTLNSNADNILVGRVLGGAALGIYSLAYSVILVPLARLAWPVHQLLAPAFARLQSDTQALAGNWVRATRFLLMVFLPLMLTVSVTAPDVVHILFGSKWDAAIPVIRILAPACAILSVQGVADAAIQAVGAMRTYFRMSAFSFGLNLAAFFIGIQWGLVGMATAFGLSTLVFMVTYFALVSRKLQTSFWSFACSIGGVIGAALALLIVEASVYTPLAHTSVGPVLRIAATTCCGLAAFVLYCVWREREGVIDAVRVLVERLPAARRFIPQVLQSA